MLAWDGRFTKEGLKRLAQIIRQARGSQSYRQFEEKLGGEPSHATLWRLEHGVGKDPDLSILKKIAPFTPYSFEELLAIALQELDEPVQQIPTSVSHRVVTAEDIWPLVQALPDVEKSRLGQMLFTYLGKQLSETDGTGLPVP